MDKIAECVFSLNSVALAVAGFIFFITLFLTAKQWVSFSITLLLLVFTLITGLIIANLDLLRTSAHEMSTEQDKQIDLRISNFEEQILKAYDNLKMEIEIQKHKLETMNEEVDAIKKQQSDFKTNHDNP